jgi:hypothetical protein
MSGTFSSRTYNFNTLLGRSSFPDYTTKRVVIPQFQRGFSWEKTHVATFWEDIWEFHQQAVRSETYFLGPIVILPESEYITVLDGQQRLATATILLASIRDLARQKGGQKGGDLARDIQRDHIFVDEDHELFALEPSELDKDFFENHIQLDPPKADEKATIRSHWLIRQAKLFLRASLDEQFDRLSASQLVDGLKKLRTTLTERLKLVVIEVGSEEEAYQIFETLNDRGLRLSVPDLLLNYLMRSSTSSAQRDKVREYWNSIVETMGTRRVSTFLRHMWVSRHGDVKSQALYREIRKHVKGRGVSSRSFAKECSKECTFYASILDVDKAILKDSAPHVNALVKNLSAEKALPILLSGIQCLSDNDYEKLCRNVVALIVRHSIVANLNPSALEDTLYDAARTIRDQKSKGMSSASILAKAKVRLKSIDPTLAQLKQGLAEVYLTKPQAQYILTEIGNKMQSDTKAVGLRKTSIEHIFPEHAKKTEWKDYDDLRPLVWHIGNLSLLEPKINRDIGNKPFATKKARYGDSKIEMTKTIPSKHTEWTTKSVIERAIALSKVIDQVWHVQ